MSETQRRCTAPRESGLLQGLTIVAVYVGLLLATAATVATVFSSELRIERLYEDGSSELSDGRSFCIAGELCAQEAP